MNGFFLDLNTVSEHYNCTMSDTKPPVQLKCPTHGTTDFTPKCAVLLVNYCLKCLENGVKTLPVASHENSQAEV